MVTGRELYTLRGEEWQKVELPWAFREGTVTQPIVTRTGDLLVGTRWGVFRRTPSATFELVSNEYVWGIHEDAAGTIWTTDIVAGYRRLGAPAPPRHPLEGAGYRLTHDRRGNLWIATFGEGLWRVRDAGRAGGPLIERANLRTGLSSDSVQSVLEDRDGNIWVGTTGGLHRLQERALTPVENVGFVVAMEPAEGARMWAGTTNGMIQFSGAPGPWARMGARSPGPDVRSLHRDKSGTLWIGASDGLWQFANGRLTHVLLPGAPQMVVMEIASDPRGGLWLGDDEWLFHWDGSRLEPFPGRADEGELQRITLARSDSSGRIWLGFSGGRVGYVDRRSRPARARAAGRDDQRPRHHPRGLRGARTRRSGSAGSGGLSRFQHGRVATLTQANGLPGGRVWAVVEDLQGRLWLNMERGLVRLERGELEQAFADPAHRIKYRFYDTSDGLAGAVGRHHRLEPRRRRHAVVRARRRRDRRRQQAGARRRPRGRAAVAAHRGRGRQRPAASPRLAHRFSGGHDPGPDPLHRAVALLLRSHPVPLPPGRHRHGVGRCRHPAHGLLYQPLAGNLSLPGGCQRRGRLVAGGAGGVELLGRAGVLSDPLVLGDGRGGRAAGGLGRVARPAAPGPAAVLARARGTRAVEPRDPRHAAPEPGRRRAAVRRHRREPRLGLGDGEGAAAPHPPAGRGLHAGRPPVDLRSALAAARGQRPGDGAAGVRQAVGQRHAHPVRVVGDRDAARELSQDRQRAAADRPGSDHQRRPPCRRVADRARAAVRGRRRDAAGLGRRPRVRRVVPRRRAQQALRVDDHARARRRAGRPPQCRFRPAIAAPSSRRSCPPR